VALFILAPSLVQLGSGCGFSGTSVDGKTQFVAPAVAVLDGNSILAARRSGNLEDELLAHSALTVWIYGAGNTKGRPNHNMRDNKISEMNRVVVRETEARDRHGSARRA
jgi:hypothetical protein